MKEQQPDAGKTARSSVEAGSPLQGETAESGVAGHPTEETRAVRIPPLLLEKDDPVPPVATGADPKFALGTLPPQGRFPAETGELPPTYGTGKLLLIPRDPHWLYAHWDLAPEQQRTHNALSVHGHMVLRVHSQQAGQPLTEIHVHPESQFWFVEVPGAGAEYTVELGYYRPSSEWISIAASSPVKTPPERPAETKSAQFGKMPLGQHTVEVGNRTWPLAEPGGFQPGPETTIPPRVEWIPALESRPELGLAAVNPERQAPSAMAQEGMTEWTLEQESALAELVRESAGQASSSLELAQWVRREIQREISSQQFGRSWQEVESSPLGGQPPRLKGFWFNVNAELIIYGATDPDASVTIGGEPIEVRADGTFACRLALPDGEYDVDVAARLEADSRQAKLRFRRSTEYQEKDVHEQ